MLGIYSEEMQREDHMALHVNIHSSITHSSCQLELMQMSICGSWVNQRWPIHSLKHNSEVTTDLGYI